MKRMFFAVLLFFTISTALMSREFIAGGKSNSALGDYKIETADKPVVINGEEFKALIISYQNSQMEVTVVIKEDEKCRNYIVLSDILSIQYVCNGSYFGIQLLDKSFKQDGYATDVEALNKEKYFYQKVITLGKNSEIDNAKLIASYFPMLIKDGREFL